MRAGRGLPHRRVERLAWNDKAQAPAKLVVMLVVSLALLGAGCARGSREDSGSAAPPAAPSTTRQLEQAPPADPVTADGVAVVALREIYTWFPDRESQDASLARARKWLGPSMIRVLDGTPAPGDAPKASLLWSQWAKAKARVEAFVFASGERPPAGPDPNTQQFKVGIEQTVVYSDGRKEQLAPETVIATVVRTPDGWRLDAFR
ncbi:hypothetical protein D5S18_33760 [Nocardia panacis]|uniref:Uncharacterized protein n=1 Tax=Nocardia panacis TaxID=2340916 RepID=A0A3A4K6D5_9NOCA|nr:hypothetical protein D5S18_33760 [Nocardia panacis]